MVIIDDSIFTILRVQILPQAATEENQSALFELMIMKKIFFAFAFGLSFISVVQAAPVAGDADVQMNDTLKELERQSPWRWYD